MKLLKYIIRICNYRKAYTILNLCGLSIGFTAFILIYNYVDFERSYDLFNPHVDNVYRVENTLLRQNEIIIESAEGLAALGEYSLKNYSEVKDYVKIYNVGAKNNNSITVGGSENKTFLEKKLFFATASFPKMFALKFLEGNGDLSKPNQVIISKSIALKYFGSKEEVLGESIDFRDDDGRSNELIISGVFEDYRRDSHLDFELVISFKTIITDDQSHERFENAWRRFDFLNYLELANDANVQSLENQLSEYATQMAGLNDDDRGYEYVFSLKPIKNIHLDKSITNEIKPTNSAKKLNIILLIGVFVLILGWINFINLTTAAAIGRAKEVGVRKVLGASKIQIIIHYLLESIIISALAFLLSM
ncbi:MAG: ABC transporter permease, partial [Fulvivirga sp.]|uniref:ABC transporter permease n=1 Tax=Fulvivirga sp. TaxID=1931237 RepID=UPI0032EBB58C